MLNMRVRMASEKDPHRLRIILDASKAKRCDWCGSPQSEDWNVSDLGIYCSDNCLKADHARNFSGSVVASIGFLPVVLAILLLPESFIDSTTRLTSFVAALFLEFMVIAVTISYYKDRRYAAEIPRGSRSHIGESELSLLRRISAPVECPNCDGNIDLTSVGTDMIYTCQYCGVHGVIDIKLQE